MAFLVPTKEKVKGVSSSIRSSVVASTPITASKNEVNVLTPVGPATGVVPVLAPNSRQLDSSGTATIRPTPVGKP